METRKNINDDTPIKIYCLIDPQDNRVRYIGWTHKKLSARLSQHIKDAKRGFENHRCNWLRKLISKNITPIINTTEDTVYSKRQEREKYWIAFYGRENLTNSTDGGEGFIGTPAWNKGMKMGKDFIEKISLAMQGRTAHNKGVPMSEEQKEKLRGQKRTDESKKKMSESQKGKEALNKGKILNVNRSSKYIGTYWNNQSQRWRSRIVVEKERIHLTQFVNEINSAIGYDIGNIFFYADKYELNFPDQRENYISYLNQYDIEDIKELRQVIKNYIEERSNYA